jgi:hypothetical protein
LRYLVGLACLDYVVPGVELVRLDGIADAVADVVVVPEVNAVLECNGIVAYSPAFRVGAFIHRIALLDPFGVPASTWESDATA